MPPDVPEAVLAGRSEYQRLLAEALEKAAAALSALEGVERVSLVGSYACGRADLFTDLDLLVIMRTELPFVERLRLIYQHLALPVDVDVLCYTPEEFAAMKERPFFRNMLAGEVVLYAKEPA